jgi:alpha/beta superfamily hydrolase
MRARWCFLAALAMTLAACGGGSGATDRSTQAGIDVTIDVPAASGAPAVRLSGVERGHGQIGVVLAHMLNSSQDAWTPLVSSLVDQGFHVLTFDFRGHGLSSGNRDASHADLDLAAAVAKLRTLGASKIFVVGASMGGTAALVVAAREDLAGVVTMSAPAQIGSLDAGAAVVSVAEPKLFIVGAKDDPHYVDAARAFESSARAPKKLEVISGSASHGTDLLVDSTAGSRVKRLIINFLIDNRG